MNKPLVSVVTPFRNTARYLAQCIESVLGQTYGDFEYILSDNGSTDESFSIVESYARRDSRIRLIRQSRNLSQVQHYNAVLAEISAVSQFCKVVQADDYIFPDCLRLMTQAFEQSETIGLVSSYYLKANTLRGSGFPYPTPFLRGKEMARLYLRTGTYVFGSPTTVMYRSSLVRDCLPFYDESLLHEDTEKCMQILQHWDFGFVHQVLSFLHVDNESISAVFHKFQPDSLDWYIITQRYAPVFLEADEAKIRKANCKREYYRILAREATQFRGFPFWRYHKQGLATLGETLDWPYLTLQIGRELLWLTINPVTAFQRARDVLRRLIGRLKVA